MPPKPRVTVVIPARNAGRFIAEALESVRAQEFEDFEAIVVDDGSSDGTYDIASGLAAEDGRFRAVPARGSPGAADPVGAGEARNLALRLARGDDVAFLDADDTWLGCRLRAGVEVLGRFPEVGLAYGLTVETDEAGEGLRDDEGEPVVRGRGRPGVMEHPVRDVLWPRNIGTINAIMVRGRLALLAGGFEERPYEDWMLNVRLASFAPLHFTPEILATYRRHGASRSAEFERDAERESGLLLTFYRDAIRWLSRRPGQRLLARELAAEHLPAFLVRAATARSGRVRRARLLLSALRTMWEFPELAFSPHTLRVPLALAGGGACYRFLRGLRGRLAPRLLFPEDQS